MKNEVKKALDFLLERYQLGRNRTTIYNKQGESEDLSVSPFEWLSEDEWYEACDRFRNSEEATVDSQLR